MKLLSLVVAAFVFVPCHASGADIYPCVERLKSFGIEVVSEIRDTPEETLIALNFRFDRSFQTEKRATGVASITYEAGTGSFLKSDLFTGGHVEMPFDFAEYVVVLSRRMLRHTRLELTYIIDSTYEDDYLNVWVAGFDDVTTLKCVDIPH